MARLRYFTCSRSGCPELVTEPGFCALHKPKPWAGRTGSDRARATGMGGREAGRLAREAVNRWPLCSVCRVRPSEQADHLIPLAWNGGPELHGICRPCHRTKTNEEAAIGRRYHGAPPADVIRAHAAKWAPKL